MRRQYIGPVCPKAQEVASARAVQRVRGHGQCCFGSGACCRSGYAPAFLCRRPTRGQRSAAGAWNGDRRRAARISPEVDREGASGQCPGSAGVPARPPLPAAPGTAQRSLYPHNRGREESQQRLKGLLRQAGMAVCPASCVSHAAYWQVTRYCKENGTPCALPSSSGTASWTEALTALSRHGETNNGITVIREDA